MNPLRRIYKRSHRLRRFIRRRKDAFTYQLARAALWVPRQLSLPRALALADRIGDLIYFALPGTRRLALEHLEIAFGTTLPVAERERIARESFRNVARVFVELAQYSTYPERFDTYMSVEGWEHWENMDGHPRGAIVITGHIGNWELLAAYCVRRGVPLAAIARRLDDPRLNKLLNDFRTGNGVRTILRESPGSSREIIKVLREHGILALLIDQDIKTPSITVPFFGRPARTPVAAAVLAVRRNLPVAPCFARRRPEGGLLFTIMDPIWPPHSGDQRQDVIELTRRFSEVLEQRIREYPAEWVWWHRRWRRGPVPRLDLDAEIQYSGTVLR